MSCKLETCFMRLCFVCEVNSKRQSKFVHENENMSELELIEIEGEKNTTTKLKFN